MSEGVRTALLFVFLLHYGLAMGQKSRTDARFFPGVFREATHYSARDDLHLLSA